MAEQLWWHVWGGVQLFGECKAWTTLLVGGTDKPPGEWLATCPYPPKPGFEPLLHLASFDHEPTEIEMAALEPAAYRDEETDDGD